MELPAWPGNQAAPEGGQTVSVPATDVQRALDRAARLTLTASREARQADYALHRGIVPEARERLTSVDRSAQEALRLLIEAGAARPEGVPAPKSDADPLRALALADTPATRRLLDLLRQATAAAEEVDAERGNVLPDDFPLQPGESRGTGWAETLSELALRLKIEVHGPRRSRGSE